VADTLSSGNVDMFISNSEAGRQSRIDREKFPPEKIITIHNGVDIPPEFTEKGRISARESFGLHSSQFVVSVIANFRKMKGHYDIIKASRHLRDISDLLFVFAGDGPLKNEIMAAVEKDDWLKRHVLFPGIIDNPQHLLQASDVFLLPSLWEGCPASVLEAMAAGIPVVASSVGGIPELIDNKETGILIPPGSPEEITQALHILYKDDKLRKRLSVNARSHAIEHFSLDKMVEKIETVFQTLLDKNLTQEIQEQ
jgi:glycosyltransferase involved in cell wall biosynthesis